MASTGDFIVFLHHFFLFPFLFRLNLLRGLEQNPQIDKDAKNNKVGSIALISSYSNSLYVVTYSSEIKDSCLNEAFCV